MYPEDMFKKVFWELFISLCLLITCILTPFNLAFDEYVHGFPGYVWFSYSIDIIFALEIILNFNTAVVTSTHLSDNRCVIANEYLKSWFIIDFLSVLPFELFMLAADETESESGVANKFVRMAKISKLYKLVKITKLIRMFKIIKKKKKIIKTTFNIVKDGRGFDRLAFFILILFLVCHFFGCLWVFVGVTFQDDEIYGDSWIESHNYSTTENIWDTYYTACYFTMQTLTTVGYGDINVVSINEKILCIFLQFIGVIFFSFASGSLTTIIANEDKHNALNREKTKTLNKILKEYKIPKDLYILLLTQLYYDNESKTLE